jgi:hypothetical protein
VARSVPGARAAHRALPALVFFCPHACVGFLRTGSTPIRHIFRASVLLRPPAPLGRSSVPRHRLQIEQDASWRLDHIDTSSDRPPMMVYSSTPVFVRVGLACSTSSGVRAATSCFGLERLGSVRCLDGLPAAAVAERLRTSSWRAQSTADRSC